MENSMESPQKIKNRNTIWSSNSISTLGPNEMEIGHLKKYAFYIYCTLFTIAKMLTKCLSIDK